jgi:hypothetical protein
MPEKDPMTYELLTYVWVTVVSLWGGAASFIRRVRKMDQPRYSVIEFIGECVISIGVGLLTFFLCEWANLDRMLAAALIGVTAHMGSRALLIGEQVLERWVKNRLGVSDEPKQNG